MSKQFNRNRRVADLVHRELAPMIQRQLANPPLGLTTISMVDLSPDLKNAKIFVTCLSGEKTTNKVIETLNGMVGHYRYELAKVLSIRSIPKLQFVYDSSIDGGSRLSALIDSLYMSTGKKKKS